MGGKRLNLFQRIIAKTILFFAKVFLNWRDKLLQKFPENSWQMALITVGWILAIMLLIIVVIVLLMEATISIFDSKFGQAIPILGFFVLMLLLMYDISNNCKVFKWTKALQEFKPLELKFKVKELKKIQNKDPYSEILQRLIEKGEAQLEQEADMDTEEMDRLCRSISEWFKNYEEKKKLEGEIAGIKQEIEETKEKISSLPGKKKRLEELREKI